MISRKSVNPEIGVTRACIAAIVASVAAILPLTEGAQYWYGATSEYNSFLAILFQKIAPMCGDVTFSSNEILVRDTISHITVECIYLDWLVWSVAILVLLCRSRRALLYSAVFIVIVVAIVNPLRVCHSLIGSHMGVPWFWAHDFLDTLIYYPSLFAVIMFCSDNYFAQWTK